MRLRTYGVLVFCLFCFESQTTDDCHDIIDSTTRYVINQYLALDREFLRFSISRHYSISRRWKRSFSRIFLDGRQSTPRDR
jgi:hypothetical protein